MVWPIPSFEVDIPFTDITISDTGISLDTPVGPATIGYTGDIDLPYGQETTVAEIILQPDTPERVVDVWLEGLEDLGGTVTDIADPVIPDTAGQTAGGILGFLWGGPVGAGVGVASAEWLGGVYDVWRDPDQSPLTPYAEAYVDWYEEGTPTERAVDVILEAGSGVGQEIEDIVTGSLETVPAIIEAGGTAGALLIEPLAEPTGEFLESLILPAVALGGLYILTK